MFGVRGAHAGTEYRPQCTNTPNFASSNHAVGFYPRHRTIGIDAPVRPDSRYGVSKAFGEALAQQVQSMGLVSHLSLSDEREFVVAVAILERSGR